MAIVDDVAWRRWLYLEYLIVCIVGSLSQRPCTNASGFIDASSYFLEDTTEYPVQYGDCSFGQSLCNYTQFCKDSDAEDWRQSGDHAECPGKTGVFDSFSVLLSLLLDISHVTCLTFDYTQQPPGRLSVYLATSTFLFIVMPEEHKEITKFSSFTAEISSTSGKLVFRARSAEAIGKVQLRGVKLQPGSCTGLGAAILTCLFDTVLSTCGWSLHNWEITRQLIQALDKVTDSSSTGSFAYVVNPSLKGTMATSLIQSTGNQTGCLEFKYILCGPDLRLLVSIQSLDGSHRVLWEGPSNVSTVYCLTTWQHAQVPVSSVTAFTVIFENVPAFNHSGVIAVDAFRYTTQSSASVCPLEPQHARPREVKSLDLNSTQKLPGSISTVTEPAIDDPQMGVTVLQSSTSGSGNGTTVIQSTSLLQPLSIDNETTPIIAGVVTAVVVVLTCITGLVIIIVIRKRRQKHERGKGTSDGSNVDEIANIPHLDSELSLVQMMLADEKDSEVLSQLTRDPHAVAEGGVPDLTRRYILKPGDVGKSRSASQSSHQESKEIPEIYSQVQKQRKEAPDTYSQVHKKQKGTVNESPQQSAAAGDFLNPSYAPDTYEFADPQSSDMAATASQYDQEYNALNFEQKGQGRANSSLRKATGQTYAHLQGDILYDCTRGEHNRHDATMVVDAEYNHLVT